MNNVFTNTKIIFDTNLFYYASIKEPLVAVPKSYLKNFNELSISKKPRFTITKKALSKTYKKALLDIKNKKTVPALKVLSKYV